MLGYLFLSIAIFLIYIGIITSVYGIRPSISDSYYNLPNDKKWIFTIATWGYTIPLILNIPFQTGVNEILFLAAALLSVVGVFPNFKVKEDRPLHVIGAEGGIFLGFVWALSAGLWYLIVPVSVVIYLLFNTKPKNHTWWIECLAYFTIILSEYILIK
jgi:hypothetical protein